LAEKLSFHMQGYSTPFSLPRAHTLLGRAGLALIGSVALCDIITIKICGSNANRVMSQGVHFIYPIFCVLFLLLIAPALSRSWCPALIIGLPPPRPFPVRYVLLALPMLGFAIASVFVVYVPLSYIAPRFVEWRLSDPVRLISGTSAVANVLSFLCIVFVGPVFEEFVFRGLLLTRWTIKWNVRRAIFLSSVLFGLLHTDVVGAFFFGYALCVLYIETQSLFVPIGVHATYNGILWIVAGGGMLIADFDLQTETTISELQSIWWVGLSAAIIFTPWAVAFVKNNIPKASWRVPYLALQEDDMAEEVQGGQPAVALGQV
jgi:membrane protease YdiL (CAAX protease family)